MLQNTCKVLRRRWRGGKSANMKESPEYDRVEAT